MNQFIVTSQGLAATRWLCHVLAAHGDVYVAHGRHSLESIVSEGAKVRDLEDCNSSYDSLTLGIQLITFYETQTLAEIFTAYKTTMPSAKAYGCVHSFSLRTLIEKASSLSENLTDNFKIVNLVRHPISYIESHIGLVKVARLHRLPIHQHYSETMFQNALSRYPELHLFEVPNTDDFIDFTVSCLSCVNQQQDFRYSSFSSIPMERITSNVEELTALCQYLTGLDFSDVGLDKLIQRGSINSHRQNQANDPLEIYDSWETWKQDIVQILFNKSLLDSFSQIGYELPMFNKDQKNDFNLNDQLKSHLDNPELFWRLEKKVETLENEIQEVTFKYMDTLMKLRDVEARFERYIPYPVPVLIEEFHGYNIVALKMYYVAVPQSIGAIDLMEVDLEKMVDILVELSVNKLKKRIGLIIDKVVSASVNEKTILCN